MLVTIAIVGLIGAVLMVRLWMTAKLGNFSLKMQELKVENTNENTPTIPSSDGSLDGIFLKRINWAKLKREIHACVAFQRKVGSDAYLCDMALYATYLYCVASHARGHLHMKVWNIDYQYKFDPEKTQNPRLGRLELNTLVDQEQFIECARKFIVDRQEWMKKYNILSIFKDLPTDFEMTKDECYDQDYKRLEAKKTRLLAEGKFEEAKEVDKSMESLAFFQSWENS